MGLPGYFTLAFPEALLLAVALVWLYLRAARVRNLWRVLLLVIGVLLLAYPSLVRSTRAVDLFVLVDRSRSISDEGRAKQQEILDLLAHQARESDRLGIVSFNDRAHVERPLAPVASFNSFGIPYSEDASDLDEGLALVQSQIVRPEAARVLVLSDGQFTGPDPMRQAQIARQAGVPLYYRDLARAQLYNLAVRDAVTPDKLLAREPYRVIFKVQATAATHGRYRLTRNGQAMGQEEAEGWREYDFAAGENSIEFRDVVETPGTYGYKLEVETIPREREQLLRDNEAERFVEIVGERPLLLVNHTGAPDNVSRVLAAGGMAHHVVAIDRFRMDIRDLDGYSGVILNNVPVIGLTLRQLDSLRALVAEEGRGLVVCGGNRSFAAGGYYKSALEPMLPVSLEDRQQSKKVSTAFSIVLDRSGSMAVTTPSGHQKIELANNAAVECVRLMSAADSVSVIAVDSAAHIFVPQQAVDDPARIIYDVRRIESMGGGIFVYTGLRAAGGQIVRAPQVNKHILLFADAADSEEPDDYVNLLADFQRAGITVSVVGLGTEGDVDAEFLKDVAKRGGGSVYFTEDAAQLVQFFTADTLTYTRNSFVEDPAPVAVRVGAYALAPEQHWRPFTSSHYNLLFTRPGAEVALQTSDEDAAPILAFWQRQLGRVVSLALDPSGPFASQPQFGDVLLSACRWAIGSRVEDNFAITVRYQGNLARIEMEVSDEERQAMSQASFSIFTPGGGTLSRPMQWDNANRLSGEVKLDERGLYRGVITAGDKVYRIGPVSMPVSPEFLTTRPPEAGRETLAQMAALTGGREALDVGQLWERPAAARALAPAVFPLLAAFLLLMLLEIAEARFGLLPRLRGRLRVAHMRWVAPMKGVARVSRPVSPRAGMPEPAPPPEPDYLSKSKQRAKRRFGK